MMEILTRAERGPVRTRAGSARQLSLARSMPQRARRALPAKRWTAAWDAEVLFSLVEKGGDLRG